MQLFYAPNIGLDEDEFTFDKTESRHIVKVLRKKVGDILHITNGKGSLYKGSLNFASDKKCTISILEKKAQPKAWDYKLHMVIAPTKNNDRLEWFLEKATEIGVDQISLIVCDHSERKIVKRERLEKVMITAMKQSLKYQLPELHDLISFGEFLNNCSETHRFMGHCEELSKTSFKTALEELKQQTPSPELVVLIGPEGDFSKNEIEMALINGFKAISLGASRLRTETAGIAAVHSVALIME